MYYHCDFIMYRGKGLRKCNGLFLIIFDIYKKLIWGTQIEYELLKVKYKYFKVYAMCGVNTQWWFWQFYDRGTGISKFYIFLPVRYLYILVYDPLEYIKFY